MKKVNREYTFSRVLKKNTCFKVQSGRSWVNSASGYVNGYVKWV